MISKQFLTIFLNVLIIFLTFNQKSLYISLSLSQICFKF